MERLRLPTYFLLAGLMISLPLRPLAAGPQIRSRGGELWVTDWDGFLARVRKKAVAYTDELPNFICTQTVRRYATLSTDDRRILDEIVAEVSFFEKKERHRILSVGNKPQPEGTEEVSLGMTSIGEFGTSLALLFDPYVRASFKFAGISSLRGRKTVCIRFEVSERTSRNVISIGTESVTVAYRGQCWVEPNSYQLMRLHSVAVRIPGTFPITQSESVTDYDMVDIAGRQYWLPVTSTVRMVAQNDEHRKAHDLYRSIMGVPSPSNYFPARMEARNLITYSKYCKFESKVKITY